MQASAISQTLGRNSFDYTDMSLKLTIKNLDGSIYSVAVGPDDAILEMAREAERNGGYIELRKIKDVFEPDTEDEHGTLFEPTCGRSYSDWGQHQDHRHTDSGRQSAIAH
jgi:hypothetical protein